MGPARLIRCRTPSLLATSPELVEPALDPVPSIGRPAPSLERRRTVLEEHLLPGVEEGGRELILVAKVGNGHAVDQMTPQNDNLLGGRVILAGLSHRRNSSRVLV